MSPAKPLPGEHLAVFCATRPAEIPDGVRRFISVDGTIPGAAVVWDHHVTGEAINLDAMPDEFDPAGHDAVATTSPDADAVASVVAVMFGGKARLPSRARALLESASYWCDHLRGHPEFDEGTNVAGRALLDHIAHELEVPRDRQSRAFAQVCIDVASAVAVGEPLPSRDGWAEQLELAKAALAAGRIRTMGDVALVDVTDRSIDPAAVYAVHDCPVSVHIAKHVDGGPRYTVGVHPHIADAPNDLCPALTALAAAEFAHGAPAKGPEPVPESENWGGRATVFGSPWNYGSRLEPEEVVGIVSGALGLRGTSERG